MSVLGAMAAAIAERHREGVTMKPTIGRIVHYALSEDDAHAINARRADPHERCRGNHAEVGQVYPAMVVRTWETSVNLKVFMDGTDTWWVTSRQEGDEPGTWAWPERVEE